MRARMTLSYSGITVALREVILRDMPAALLAGSPKGTVPVLVLPDGRVLEESRDIIDWALGVHDPDQWQPVSGGDGEVPAMARRGCGNIVPGRQGERE
jgi:glutathione S-transferase